MGNKGEPISCIAIHYRRVTLKQIVVFCGKEIS